jgi:hypothetical protein
MIPRPSDPIAIAIIERGMNAEVDVRMARARDVAAVCDPQRLLVVDARFQRRDETEPVVTNGDPDPVAGRNFCDRDVRRRGSRHEDRAKRDYGNDDGPTVKQTLLTATGSDDTASVHVLPL